MTQEEIARKIEELEFSTSNHSAYLELLDKFFADIDSELEYIRDCVMELPYEKAQELLEKIEAIR